MNAARTVVKKVFGAPSSGREGQLQALIGKVLENTEDLKFSQVGRSGCVVSGPCPFEIGSLYVSVVKGRWTVRKRVRRVEKSWRVVEFGWQRFIRVVEAARL